MLYFVSTGLIYKAYSLSLVHFTGETLSVSFQKLCSSNGFNGSDPMGVRGVTIYMCRIVWNTLEYVIEKSREIRKILQCSVIYKTSSFPVSSTNSLAATAGPNKVKLEPILCVAIG